MLLKSCEDTGNNFAKMSFFHRHGNGTRTIYQIDFASHQKTFLHVPKRPSNGCKTLSTVISCILATHDSKGCFKVLSNFSNFYFSRHDTPIVLYIRSWYSVQPFTSCVEFQGTENFALFNLLSSFQCFPHSIHYVSFSSYFSFIASVLNNTVGKKLFVCLREGINK